MTQTITTSGAGLTGAASTATTRLTRALRACGVVDGPLFTVVVVVQMLTRDGFGPTRHPLSLLSLGGLGWIQIANFVAAGLLIVAAPLIAVAAFLRATSDCWLVEGSSSGDGPRCWRHTADRASRRHGIEQGRGRAEAIDVNGGQVGPDRRGRS